MNNSSAVSKLSKISSKPLNLNEIAKSIEPLVAKPTDDCILCERSFDVTNAQQEFLTHLFTQHRLVISDVGQIGELSKYLTSVSYQCTLFFI